MPRPKPKSKKASPTFLVHPHSLSDEAERKILGLLGYSGIDLLKESVRIQHPGFTIEPSEPGGPIRLKRDPNPQAAAGKKDLGTAILDIEQILGLGVDGAEHIDRPPRPADYRDAIEPIHKKALALYNELVSLNGYYFSEALELEGADVNSIEVKILELAESARKVVDKYRSLPSKGARKNNALCEVIRGLRRIFRKHYSGPFSEPVRKGPIQGRTEQEKRELEFLKTALCDARLVKQGYSIEELARLLRDPRCSVPEERNEVLERLAKKNQSSRRRKQKRNKK